MCVRMNTCPEGLSGAKILSRASVNLLSLPAVSASYGAGSREVGMCVALGVTERRKLAFCVCYAKLY